MPFICPKCKCDHTMGWHSRYDKETDYCATVYRGEIMMFSEASFMCSGPVLRRCKIRMIEKESDVEEGRKYKTAEEIEDAVVEEEDSEMGDVRGIGLRMDMG